MTVPAFPPLLEAVLHAGDPIVLHEGRGTRVKDVDGREYLDFFGGILTLSLGH